MTNERGDRCMSDGDKGVFFRGLLLALRAYRTRFLSDGEPFHEAFGQMLRAAEPDFPVLVRHMREGFDPVFGVYRDAERMVLSGMQDMLLALESPRMAWASYTVSEPQADKELRELGNVETFRRIAARFDEHMGVERRR
jgi:hypothetical protein